MCVQKFIPGILIIVLWPTGLFSQFNDKVMWKSPEWKVIHTKHFDIHYPEENQFLGNKCAEIAEQANIFISEKLAHNLSEVIPVYIYPSHSYFQMNNIVPDSIDEGIAGLTESGNKRILVPYNGSYDELRHTLTHEIVHAFQYDIILNSTAGEYVGIPSQPSTPLWLIEGMAEYYSIGWDSRSDLIIRDAVLSDTMPSLQDLSDYRVLNPMLFYKGGQIALQYIAITFGEKKIAEILRDSRDQKNINDALKTNLGISMVDLNNNWLLWLKRTYYTDVEKKSGSESGEPATFHLKDKSLVNLYPAISPDGKKIAYITVRNFNPVIVMRNTGDFPPKTNYDIRNEIKTEETIVVQGGMSETFYQLHLIDNNISFTSDSNFLFFAARSHGKDILYLLDYRRKAVVNSWQPDLDMIQYPSLSPDNNFAVFSGSRSGKTDLYILNLKTRQLEQLTNDYFSEKDPVFSADGKNIYYSTNENINGNIESNDYDIHEWITTEKKSRKLFHLNGIQEKPQIVAHNRNSSLLFVSDHEGGINAYFYIPAAENGEEKIRRVTNSFQGILSVKPDNQGEKFIMSMYRYQGYDVALADKSSIFKNNEVQNIEKIPDKYNYKNNYLLPFFPDAALSLKNIKPENYVPRFTLDGFYFGVAYSNYSGLGGFAIFSISEYMGDHRIRGIVDYLGQENNLNFQLDYTLLKYRLNWHAGLFRASSYYSILNLTDLTSLNNLIYDPNQFSQSMYRFGGYVKAVYPWTNFLKNDIGLEIFRYEEIFRNYYDQKRINISTNVYAISTSMTFNNALYSYFGPVKGTHLQISDRQTLNITGNDYVYNSLVFDARQYFNFFERYVFAMRFVAGAVSGPQKDIFPWQIGGPFTIRGYDFLSLLGVYTFMFNLELRFPLIDYFIMGFPVQWALRGFTAVIFLDAGSAFNDFQVWKGYDEQKKILKDLRLSFGLGLRFVLIPGILLHFDWATPVDFKNVIPLSQWKFNFSLGYEY